MTTQRSAAERDLAVEKLVAGGDGLAFLDGKAVFVPGVLPGETARVRIAESRRDFNRAKLLGVRSASADRVSPACPLAGICGGCDWMHIAHERQLACKREILRESMRRAGGIECGDIGIEKGPPLGYRNRAQIHRDRQGRLGYMGARSDRIVPVESCPVAVAPIDGVFRSRVPTGLDRFVVFSNGEWVASEGIDDDRELSVPVLGIPISFSVGCFFQGNLAVLDRLASFALDGLAGDTAADLYCGVGLFGALLGARFKRITAVESSSLSVSFARRNIRGPESEFFPMTVEQWIESGGAHKRPDAVIVDPPRAGLGPEVRQRLCALKSPRLVYVSCNPVTLARDLGQLVRAGYALERLRIFDFYPQTSHIETVARLALE
ncbi:MAG: class I SAM-dependent RNA methyltransferase [Acidobacteria bacterium]|nr:class I SAM-dependent RNA methyltransferase [Acidobacteriota bacterium]